MVSFLRFLRAIDRGIFIWKGEFKNDWMYSLAAYVLLQCFTLKLRKEKFKWKQKEKRRED